MGAYCKNFRLEYFNINLTDFSKLNNVNVKNLWAFENGKADKIKYVVFYMKYAKKLNVLDEFSRGLFLCL